MKVRHLLGAGVVAALVPLARRVAMLRRVPPELRLVGLAVPLSVVGPRSLAWFRGRLALSGEVADGVAHRVERVPGGPEVHVYEPPQVAGARVVLWMHGGGYVMGSAVNDHAQVSALAAQLGVTIVGVDYRLAPEHPAPAALEDCWAALAWLLATRDGLAPSDVVVAGASAGGGLAAALAQRAHDRGVGLGGQVLVYPMLDDRTVRRAAGRRPWLAWTAASNRYAWGAYLGARPGSRDVVTEAVPARREDLTGLAPAWIGVGDQDQFHDECVAYAARLRAAGVPCTLHVQPGLYHGADGIFEDRTAPTRAFRAALAASLTGPAGPRPPR